MAMLPHVQKPQTVTGGVSSPGTAPSCQEPLRPPTPYLPGSHHPEEAGLMPGCPEFKEATHGRPDTHTQEDPPRGPVLSEARDPQTHSTGSGHLGL